MSNNSSIISIATVLALLTGCGAAYTSYQYYQDNAQQRFLLKVGYQLQSNALQAVYLAERAATDSSFTSDMENHEAAVEKALAALHGGEPILGIAASPQVLQGSIKGFERVWGEIEPSISKIISQRTVSTQYSRNLADTQRMAADALSAGKEALRKLESIPLTSGLKSQLKAALDSLEEGQLALTTEAVINTETLRAASSAFSQYVVTLTGTIAASMPRDQPQFVNPLVKSYRDSESVVRLVQKTIESSAGVTENIPHAKTIWVSRDRIATSSSALVNAIEGLPESRAINFLVVAALGAISLLMAIASMLMMRVVTISRTESIENQGRYQEESITRKSKALIALLDEIGQIESGMLKTRLTEENESTKDIAIALNKTFGKFAKILDDVKETIVGLSAATEQTLVTERNVAQNRGEQDKAIEHISKLFGDLSKFIKGTEGMTLNTQKISNDMGRKVASGEIAVSQVHDNILELAQQTGLIQNRSKNLIESLQVLENIATVVETVAARSSMVAYNANLLADEMQDKAQSGRIAGAARAMTRLSEETKDAVVQINVQLKTMTDAARANQSAVDAAQRETEKLRDRSNVAQDALKDIKHLAGDLTQGAQQAIEETKQLKAKSGDVSDLVDSVNQYSADNSAASEQTAVAIKGVNIQAQALQATIAQFSKE